MPTTNTYSNQLTVDAGKLAQKFKDDKAWCAIQRHIKQCEKARDSQVDKLTEAIKKLSQKRSALCAKRTKLKNEGGPRLKAARRQLRRREVQIVNTEIAREVKALCKIESERIIDETAQERKHLACPLQDPTRDADTDNQEDGQG